MMSDIQSLSPLDGRYKNKTSPLRAYFSEAALISKRIIVEIEYLKVLSKYGVIRSFSSKEQQFFEELALPTEKNLQKVKKIEEKTHHDVKAVEYYLREKIEASSLADVSPFIHFAVTSADINNLSYRLMIKGALDNVMKDALYDVLSQINSFSEKYAAVPMLARTHGQAAIPTTLGKEFVVYGLRVMDLIVELQASKLKGKCNGAVGGYQAMAFTYPDIEWTALSKEFVTSFGFDHAELTTQIAPADDMVKIFSIVHRLNSILIDLNQDIWRYISDGWLVQKKKKGYVGSSTMPQKINPIEFENSEGNLGLANSLLEGFIRKLPISRLQRDLSESTVLRNIGSAFGYCLLSYKSLSHGMSKLAIDENEIHAALHKNHNILMEAWQTEIKKSGDSTAYEKAAKIGKSKIMSKEDWQDLAKGASESLYNLTPEKYIGLSVQLTNKKNKKINKFLQKNMKG